VETIYTEILFIGLCPALLFHLLQNLCCKSFQEKNGSIFFFAFFAGGTNKPFVLFIFASAA
jgi:hypothetical protein